MGDRLGTPGVVVIFASSMVATWAIYPLNVYALCDMARALHTVQVFYLLGLDKFLFTYWF